MNDFINTIMKESKKSIEQQIKDLEKKLQDSLNDPNYKDKSFDSIFKELSKLQNKL